MTGLPTGFEATGPPLGTGATAVVWPARRVLDGREFALKVWRRPFADERERERFRREVRQQARLNQVSGHVVTYSWSEEDPAEGTPWIGTQRHGVSLQQVLDLDRPPLPEALVLGADLLAGLAAVHGLGTLHRDIKPGNVLVEGGRAKLCDLGLVMDSSSWTQDEGAGTPRYIAPELLAGEARPSPRTDVYAAAQTIRQAVGPEVPEPLEQLLTEAASVAPGDRPADADAFEARFRQACSTLGHSLPPPLPAAGRPEEPARSDGGPAPRRRRRAALAGLAVVGVLGGAAAAVLWQQGHGPRAGTPVASSQPDAALAAPDIQPDGRPALLAPTHSGRCPSVVTDAISTGAQPYLVDGTELAEIRTYYSRVRHEACAKLVKPTGSPYAGRKTHLALTLCGDGNSCDHDWNAYAIDAGPVVVPSRTGCVSWRVSLTDDSGSRWLLRDVVQSFGCS